MSSAEVAKCLTLCSWRAFWRPSIDMFQQEVMNIVDVVVELYVRNVQTVRTLYTVSLYQRTAVFDAFLKMVSENTKNRNTEDLGWSETVKRNVYPKPWRDRSMWLEVHSLHTRLKLFSLWRRVSMAEHIVDLERFSRSGRSTTIFISLEQVVREQWEKGHKLNRVKRY
jgi:hypothetical protein